MLAARNLGSGMNAQGQVYLGSVDLAFHTEPSGDVDTLAVESHVFEEETLFRSQPHTYYHAAFGHLVGYQAGYYGYLWSEVFAQDMFGRFRELGLLDPAAGREYRERILAPGGTRDAMELLEGYLGREPRPDAFLEHLGLTDPGDS
jgi:thimet oligopeptidase